MGEDRGLSAATLAWARSWRPNRDELRIGLRGARAVLRLVDGSVHAGPGLRAAIDELRVVLPLLAEFDLPRCYADAPTSILRRVVFACRALEAAVLADPVHGPAERARIAAVLERCGQ